MECNTLTEQLTHWATECPDRIWLRDLSEEGQSTYTWQQAKEQVDKAIADRTVLVERIEAIAAGDLTGFRLRQLVDQHDLSAQSAHHSGALGGVALRHHRDKRMALNRADDRQPRAGVAAGQLDDRLSGPQ